MNENKSIRKLNLGHNLISDISGVVIGKMLTYNSSLNVLYLHWNKIRGKGGEAIANAFKDHPTLKVLDLGSNAIGACKNYSMDAVRAICNALNF